MKDIVRDQTVYDRISHPESDTRTFSYQSESMGDDSEVDDDDELSEPEIAASMENAQSIKDPV